MSESLQFNQEKKPQHVEDVDKQNHEYNHAKSSQVEELKQKEKLDEARQGLESISVTSEQTIDKIKDMTKSSESVSQSPKNVNKDLRKAGLQKELAHIRRKMGKTDQIGSKVIHNKAVSVISSGLSKTIVRPSGMLSGAVIALVGTSLYYFFTKSVGVKYNYFIYIILFVGGFVVGLLIELIFRIFKKDKNLKFN